MNTYMPFVHGRPRLDSLTGLRAVAAFAVFVGHMMARFEGDPARVLSYVSTQGGMGVSFFFLLSGFVLTWSYREGDAQLPFWRRRFARIYPAYFVALLGGLILTAASSGMAGKVGPLAANAFVAQAWIPDPTYYFGINGVGWSLSVEAFFYLLFPLFIPTLVRIKPKTLLAAQVALLFCIFAVALVGNAMGGEIGSWFAGKLPVTRTFEFVLGCTAAVQVLRGTFPKIPWAPAGIATLAIVLVAGQMDSPLSNTAIPVIPFLLLIVAAAQRDASGRGTFFARRRIVWLGEISYCFYLVHQLVIRAMGALGDTSTWGGATWRFFVALALSVLCAWALHALIEVPFERRLRGSRRSVPTVRAGRLLDETAAK